VISDHCLVRPLPVRALIDAAARPADLDRWIARAGTAASIAELFD
jgi:hypothetical protein